MFSGSPAEVLKYQTKKTTNQVLRDKVQSTMLAQANHHARKECLSAAGWCMSMIFERKVQGSKQKT
jgi:hypothetical protein